VEPRSPRISAGRITPGTEDYASSDPLRTDCISIDSEAPTEIQFVVPTDQIIPLPSSIWLAVTMSRAGACVILGAPELQGFFDHMIDVLGFLCNDGLEGSAGDPHASFNASIYGDSSCPDAFSTYRNVRAANGGINPGANICIADAITLNRTCNMVEMTVGVRNRGLYDVELRQADKGQPRNDTTGEYSIDNSDYWRFRNCRIDGVDTGLPPSVDACLLHFDTDDNGALDLRDIAAFQNAYTGS